MSSPWNILGLNGPTDDLREIKKAYAKKLKTTRPDDDPAAFMALREALEKAQGHAYYQHHIQAHSQSKDSDEDVETDTSELIKPILEETETPATIDDADAVADDVILMDTHQHPAPKDKVDGVMDDLHRLMQDPFGRTDTKRWTKLLGDKRLEAIDDANDFEDAFLYYLLDNFGYFDGNTAKHNQNRSPKPITSFVATHIFNEMGWRDSLSRPLYIQDQLIWLKRDLDVVNRSRPVPNEAYGAPVMIEQTDGNSKWIPITIFCFYILYLAYNAVSNAG